MAEEEAQQEREAEPRGRSSNGDHSGRRAVVRAAALAAASGATAVVARRAIERVGSKRDGHEGSPESSSDDESLLTSVVTSGWDAARDSLVPIVEEAADHAGRFVAESAPAVVRDTIVPRFISAFESARGK
jgi:hypothetical protein